MSPEVSPIVVPSMSAATLDFYQSTVASNYGYQQYYRQPVVQSSSYHQMHHIPIHHTLENATITYDTVEQDFQKDLVKDVFFSPAMIHGREMSPDSTSSASSTCAQSDNESDPATPPRETFSPHETPSDLLMLDDNVHLFDFGLDLATTSNNSTQTTTSSYEEVIMMAKKKPAFTLSLNTKKFDFSNCLPTPPANDFFFPQQQKNKRRCSDSVLQDRLKKKQRVSSAHLRAFASPPTSPRIQSTLKNETIFETHCDYFEDASGEESSDDEHYTKRSSLEYNHLNTASDFQSHTITVTLSDDEDSFSTTSWEEEEEEVVSDGEESVASEEEDDEFKAPVKYTPKKHKKTILMQSNNTIVHPLCNNNKKKPFEQVVDHPPVLCDDTSNVSPRPTATPTIYQKLTKASIDWCRYCGTTEGVNWRPGPWGKRTLCNKHGCDYKGYGFACKLPRLDLTAFTRESIDDRERPVLQLYCSGCQRKDSWESNVLVRCEGCPKAFHQNCCPTAGELTDAFVNSKEAWFCDASCCENTRRKRIVVELPRKRLPLMCAPKSNALASSVSSESSCRPRTLRESSISSTR
ncbi:hypothetical protein BDF21DRAFT_417824 [Thamnidium elegans]|nr:hypothetical protein BDF21DRAFT_417824 [Thamnidium elegans]